MPEKPEIYALSRLPWQLFITLTFVRESLPVGLCRKYWFVYVRTIAGNFGVHFSNVLWLLRSEFGETNGRFHYHALVGGLPPHIITQATCFALKRQWVLQKPLTLRKDWDGEFRMLSRVCGMANVRIYQSGMDGLDYFLPGTPGGDVHPSGYSRLAANSYEANKFGKADAVEWSLSCARMAQRRIRSSAKVLQSAKSEVSHTASKLTSLPGLSRGSVPGAAITRDTALYITSVSSRRV